MSCLTRAEPGTDGCLRVKAGAISETDNLPAMLKPDDAVRRNGIPHSVRA